MKILKMIFISGLTMWEFQGWRLIIYVVKPGYCNRRSWPWIRVRLEKPKIKKSEKTAGRKERHDR